MRTGFTLIEIMITIVILGVVATLAMPKFTGIKESTAAGEAVQVLTSLLQAQQRYCLEHTNAAGTCDYPFTDGSTASNQNACKTYDVDFPGLNNFILPQCHGSGSAPIGAICILTKDSTGYGWNIRVYPDNTWGCPDDLSQCPGSVLKVLPK
ncbi:MAG: type II secretion system protein [Candidatus Omnitrophica bacterium]|nr:type II secretion system protein [Candidatus Omnitrophota bacterium]